MGLRLSGAKEIFTLVFDVDDFITVASLSIIIVFTEIELRDVDTSSEKYQMI